MIKLLSNRLGITLCTLVSQSLSFTVHYDIIIKMSYKRDNIFLDLPIPIYQWGVNPYRIFKKLIYILMNSVELVNNSDFTFGKYSR